MDKDIIKKITLKPVKCIRQSKQNPYMRGLVMKRDQMMTMTERLLHAI